MPSSDRGYPLCQWSCDGSLAVSGAALEAFRGISVRALIWQGLVLCTTFACGGTLDAGSDDPRGLLPLDERNPIILCNDGATDNWQGEYAILFASTDGPPLSGIVINAGWPWTDLDENMAGWQQMVDAAHESGLTKIPDPVPSDGPALVRPEDGDIDSTEPNRSAGARFIVETSQEVSTPSRPAVVVTGGSLTDVADAYLMDHTITDRVIVVSALGTAEADSAAMGLPNGQVDAWAGAIVAQRYRYVQVTGYSFDPSADVPSSELSRLPSNPFGEWIAAKQPDIKNAIDQVGIMVVAMPSFVSNVIRVEPSGEDADGIPLLAAAPGGSAEVVTSVDTALGVARLWEMLLDPATFGEE